MSNNRSKVMLIPPTGEPTTPRIEFLNGNNGLKKMKELVGGYIEVVNLAGQARWGGRHMVMIVNEDGWSKGLAANRLASIIYSGTIVGPAIVMGMVGENFTEVSEEFLTWFNGHSR